jgi:hypothetical protein
MDELESWLDMTMGGVDAESSVDALFGCSSRLPKLMVSLIPRLITWNIYSRLLELVGGVSIVCGVQVNRSQTGRAQRASRSLTSGNQIYGDRSRLSPSRWHLVP